MKTRNRVSLQSQIFTLFTIVVLIAGVLVAAPQASAKPVEAGSEIA